MNMKVFPIHEMIEVILFFCKKKKKKKNTYQDDDSEDNFYKDYFDESNYFTPENSASNKDVEEIFQSFKFKK